MCRLETCLSHLPVWLPACLPARLLLVLLPPPPVCHALVAPSLLPPRPFCRSFTTCCVTTLRPTPCRCTTTAWPTTLHARPSWLERGRVAVRERAMARDGGTDRGADDSRHGSSSSSSGASECCLCTCLLQSGTCFGGLCPSTHPCQVPLWLPVPVCPGRQVLWHIIPWAPARSKHLLSRIVVVFDCQSDQLPAPGTSGCANALWRESKSSTCIYSASFVSSRRMITRLYYTEQEEFVWRVEENHCVAHTHSYATPSGRLMLGGGFPLSCIWCGVIIICFWMHGAGG